MVDGGGGRGDNDAGSVRKRSSRWRERRERRKQRNQRYYRHAKKRLRKTAVWGYDGLVEALIARRHALGWTQLELDERAGFQSGYTGKLENWRGPQGRVAGSVTMPLWLQALGIGFLPVTLADGKIADQAKALAEIDRPQLPLADLTRRIPKEPKP